MPSPAEGLVPHTELLVCVFLRSGQTAHGRPAHLEIITRAQAAGISGATVLHGFAGFGAAGAPARPGLFGDSGFEPVLVEIADAPERVTAFLPELTTLAGHALIVSRSVTVMRRPAPLRAAGSRTA